MLVSSDLFYLNEGFTETYTGAFPLSIGQVPVALQMGASSQEDLQKWSEPAVFNIEQTPFPHLIESVITKRGAGEMKLKVGDKISAVIKSTEVMLEKN